MSLQNESDEFIFHEGKIVIREGVVVRKNMILNRILAILCSV